MTFDLLKALSQKEDFKVHAVLFCHGILWEKLTEAGIQTVVFDEKQNDVFKTYLKLHRHIEGEHYNIIHTHGYKANILSLLARRASPKSKFVRTEHGLAGFADKKQKTNVTHIVDSISARFFTDLVLTVSEEIKRVKYSSFPNGKVVVVYNGIDPSRNSVDEAVNVRGTLVRCRHGISPEVMLVGLIGRLVPIKGVDIFLEIARMIVQKTDRVRFVVIGDGPLRESLERHSRSLGVADKVVFVGFQDPIEPYFSAIDALAITSYHEGIPIVLLEAMLQRVPVISFSVGGLPEVLVHGESGILVPFGERKTFAEELFRLLNDDSLKNRLVTKAENLVKSRFTVNQMVENTVKAYRDVQTNT